MDNCKQPYPHSDDSRALCSLRGPPLFRTKLSAAAALSTEESLQLAAAPGLVDLVLTALTPNTLRIGIAQ